MRRVFLAAAAAMVLHSQVPDARLLNVLNSVNYVRGVTHLALEIRKDWKPKPELRSWSDLRHAHPEQWKAFLASRYPARKPPRDSIPGAMVEVWSEASWARQDEFKAFVHAHLPACRTAFDSGLSAGVGGEHLANLMAGDPSARSPLIGSKVWYNATDPWAQGKAFPR